MHITQFRQHLVDQCTFASIRKFPYYQLEIEEYFLKHCRFGIEITLAEKYPN
jgi:hypothetical protein